uniref:Uncharacterized protein n=1 Tax=Timema poppense TaxID=170557 RepID=A0A7R9DW24_TIMPO|nr:unnamed protein product [Timema poppensis]
MRPVIVWETFPREYIDTNSRVEKVGAPPHPFYPSAGTVCQVSQHCKLVVQLHDTGEVRKLALGAVVPLPTAHFNLDKMLMTENMLDTWATLVSLITHEYSDRRQPSCVPGAVNVTLLRTQQQRLTAMNAIAVLFRHQMLLRHILRHRTLESSASLEALNEGEDLDPVSETLLVQRLIVKATQPSPLKSTFGKAELEVSCADVPSLCQIVLF